MANKVKTESTVNLIQAYKDAVITLEIVIKNVSEVNAQTKSTNETVEQLKRDVLNSLVIAKGKFNSAIKFFDVISNTKFMIYNEDGKLIQAPLEKVLKSIQSVSEITKETKI